MSLYVDIFYDFLKTQWRKEYLLVITDCLNKMTEMVPVKGISAAEGASHFMNARRLKNVLREKLKVENGGCYTTKLFIDVWKLM